ncbi:hypothetical protein EV383_4831 [Pseudonocardia sediminis]|uniref:Protocatechuate 3,4-dioxygenase beta subunit n=1 Tax=Pseudonocardia sediminis TaxID=1397368 RepID=A0A4Q7V5G3_PSEST|nr:hypothetical protein [Pseudonocardia sediminis]RZT87899.1 hypothetical protein EV383_4831 [Pseudonocardia sediminis]
MTGRVRLGRRALFALAGVAACGACAEAPAAPASPSPAGARLHTRWDTRSDGPVPAAGDEGVPFVVTVNGPPGPPSVRAGALEGNLPDAPGAAYVNQDLGTPLRRVGARFSFGPGEETGSLCLAAWVALPYRDTHCHLVVTPRRWIYGVIRDLTLSEVGSGTFARPLPQDETPVVVEAVLDGPRATLHLPDGTTTSLDDPRIAAAPGSIACWEFYKYAAGAADVRLHGSWAT